MRIGVPRVAELAAGRWLSKVVPPMLRFYDETAVEFWRHSVASAVYAERLALVSGHPRGSAFTGGLLHDVGKLAIAKTIGAGHASTPRWLRPGETMLSIERDTLGADHSEVGAELARRWELPDAVALAIRWHHGPSSAPPPHEPLADLIHVASSLGRVLGFGADLGGLQRDVDAGALRRLGVGIDQLQQVALDALTPLESLLSSILPPGAPVPGPPSTPIRRLQTATMPPRRQT
jgi:putative nucleotidyltransferase with HDIG domain